MARFTTARLQRSETGDQHRLAIASIALSVWTAREALWSRGDHRDKICRANLTDRMLKLDKDLYSLISGLDEDLYEWDRNADLMSKESTEAAVAEYTKRVEASDSSSSCSSD